MYNTLVQYIENANRMHLMVCDYGPLEEPGNPTMAGAIKTEPFA